MSEIKKVSEIGLLDSMLNGIHPSWRDFLVTETKKDYFKNLLSLLVKELNNDENVIFPNQKDWLNALTIPKENLKVILIGQDPYHGQGQAHGFSFSVLPGVKLPPSLKNIYKEIESEYGIKMDFTKGTLTPWVEQGIMLLNSILTVKEKTPASHKDFGWGIFTDNLIEYISKNCENKVFLLWGAFSKSKENLVDKDKHLILQSAHPSPFSARNGFFGNQHFLKTNEYLKSKNQKEINWII